MQSRGKDYQEGRWAPVKFPKSGAAHQCDQVPWGFDVRFGSMLSKNALPLALLLGKRFGLTAGWASPPDRRTPQPNCHATYAIDAHTPSAGGPSRPIALFFRFCPIAAS